MILKHEKAEEANLILCCCSALGTGVRITSYMLKNIKVLSVV